VVPKPRCDSRDRAIASVVGLGNYDAENNKVLTEGSLYLFSGCSKGKPNYSTGVMLDKNIKVLSLGVKYWQRTTVTAVTTSNKISYIIQNLSTKKSVSYALPCISNQCNMSFAYYGIHRATANNKLLAIPDFGRVQFSNVQAR
jgi:hypothetical protein